MDLTAIETVAGQLVDMGWKNEGNGFGTSSGPSKIRKSWHPHQTLGHLGTLLRQVHHFPTSFWDLKLCHKIHFSHFCGRSSACLGTSQCRR